MYAIRSYYGIDNGAIDSVNPYQTNKSMTANGKCLFMVQKPANSQIKITAKTSKVTSNTISL